MDLIDLLPSQPAEKSRAGVLPLVPRADAKPTAPPQNRNPESLLPDLGRSEQAFHPSANIRNFHGRDAHSAPGSSCVRVQESTMYPSLPLEYSESHPADAQ